MATEPKIRRRSDGFFDVSGSAGVYDKPTAIRVARSIKSALDAAEGSGVPYDEANPGPTFTAGQPPHVYTANQLEAESGTPVLPTLVTLADGSVVAFNEIAPGEAIVRTDDASDDHLDGGTLGPSAPPTSGDFDGTILDFSDVAANQVVTRHATLARLVGVDQQALTPPYRADWDGDILTFSDITANQLAARHPTLARIIGIDPASLVPVAGSFNGTALDFGPVARGQVLARTSAPSVDKIHGIDAPGTMAVVNKSGGTLKKGMTVKLSGSTPGEVTKHSGSDDRNCLGVCAADILNDAAGVIVCEGEAEVYTGDLVGDLEVAVPAIGSTLWAGPMAGAAYPGPRPQNVDHYHEIGVVTSVAGYGSPGFTMTCRLRLTASRRRTLPMILGTFSGGNGDGQRAITTNSYPVPAGSFLMGTWNVTDGTFALPNFDFAGGVGTADFAHQVNGADLTGKDFVGLFLIYDAQIA